MDKARKNPSSRSGNRCSGGDQKKYARVLFGKIGNIVRTDRVRTHRVRQARHLAFEKLRLRDLLSEVDKFDGSAWNSR